MTVRADLHVHSCLSPCGDLENSPAAIARKAASIGVDIVGLCDHNTALNCPAFRDACRREGIVGVYGLEVSTREEIHVLCLFETPDDAVAFGAELYPLLAEFPHDPVRFGDQVIVDVDEVILGELEKSLFGAIDLPLSDIVAQTLERGGLSIPAHIDRTAHSIGSQIGFLPDEPFSAVEVTRDACEIQTGRFTRITNSDAHFLADIGARHFTFEARSAPFAALARALRDDRVSMEFAPRAGG